ncbi:Uncharacterised protein [Bordetella pertussis]|nr:Uncharacterised protein [Bordetella pertussis]
MPLSSRKVALSASEYLVPRKNTWPTSMPRWMDRAPLPSGEGSPSTTLRRSATSSGSGRSRPQLAPW